VHRRIEQEREEKRRENDGGEQSRASEICRPAGQGRLLFIIATHCVAVSETDTIVLAKSFVNCNRDAGLSAPGNGAFQRTVVAMFKIDFAIRYGLKSGFLIALLDTRIVYAQPVAVGAVTTAWLSQSVPNFSAGFPQVDQRFEGCTQANLGNVLSIHYSRLSTTLSLTSSGIQIARLSACGGNSGGTMIDEEARVLFGVSASSVSCVGGTSSNYYSRIVAMATEEGVPFLSLAGGLVSGQVVFVN
jgi:hypothetical protein